MQPFFGQPDTSTGKEKGNGRKRGGEKGCSCFLELLLYMHRYKKSKEPIMILWISGPYGVGKSTLAEVLAGQLPGAMIF